MKGDSTTPADPGDSIIMKWIRDHLEYPHDDYCLIWPFGKVRGYGSFGRNGKSIKAHRYICELKNGPPPTPEHHAAHSCNRGHDACVNHHHLRWKTPSANFKEAVPHRKLKLLPEQAKEIRDLKGLEHATITAERFGIAEVTVRNIQAGRLWREGVKRGRAFRDAEIRHIRSLQGDVSGPVVAKQYEVSANVIYRIWSRATWGFVPDLACQDAQGEKS